jgi:hypothetical protein
VLKNLTGTLSGSRLHIEDYPTAVALKRIDDPIARQLCSIALNHADLSFCREAVAEITRRDRTSQPLIAEALWVAAISRYFKCFGSNKARTQLSSRKVLKSHVSAEKVFAYFQNLRDKHIVHDENPYSQAVIGVAINARDAEHKIADVISLTMNAFTIDDSHLSSFSQLVNVTLEWVRTKQDELHATLGKQYEAQSYDELMALSDVSYNVATSEKVSTSR